MDTASDVATNASSSSSSAAPTSHRREPPSSVSHGGLLLSPWDQPGLGWLVLVAVPASLAGVLLNAIVLVEVLVEKGRLTRHQPYLASLAVCDGLNAACALPLNIAKSLVGDLASSLQVGHAWFCLDATFRTVALLHLTASSLDFYLELNGTVWYLSAQKRRHTMLKLLVCWTVSLVLSLPPHFWYHSVVAYGSLSGLRKLILCVFVLTFVFPLVAQALAYAVLLRTWMTTRREFVKFETDLRGRAWPQEARKGLMRTESGLSRRGSHRRQPSYRGGSARRAKGQTPGKMSPQLDRHPSLRYSIKRRRSGASVVIDPVPPVETRAVDPEKVDRNVLLDPAVIERRLVEVAASRTEESAVTTSDQETTGLLPVQQDQFLTEYRGLESQRSSRSSKSGSDSPKIDRHPSLRFSTRRRNVDSSRKNSSRNSLEPAAADPYLLLSGLQVSHKKLSTQVSFPDTYSWQEQNFYLPHGKAHLSSGEELHAPKVARKRGGSARRSANRKEIKRSQTSPKLDRHPSLRFSTKHRPTEKSRKKTTASTLSIPTQGNLGGTVSDFCRRKTSSTLSIAHRNSEQLRPSRSTGGSNVSIGTCHDLQASLSSNSIKNRNLPTSSSVAQQGTPRTPCSFHTADDKLNVLQDVPKNLTNSCHHHHQNLARVAVSDRDLALSRRGASGAAAAAGGGDDPNNALSAPDAGPSGKRRRSAEDPAGSSNRSSFRRRQFQRDTNHAVEDWLSLEASSSSRKPAPVGLQQRALLSPIEDADGPRATTTTATVLYGAADVGGHNREMSPRSYFRRNVGDFALVTCAAGVTVLLSLPWAVAALVVGFCAGSGDESGTRYPELLFCLQCLSSLVVIARPIVYHVAHAGFRKAFKGLMGRMRVMRHT